MTPQWIADDEALTALCAQLAGCDSIAVDTEFRRRDTFYPQVALVQVATDTTVWLIDPLPLTDPTPLRTLLTDGSVVKVLHSASEDLEVFERWLGCRPTPLFDTQKAAAMLGLGFGLSYRDLVAELTGVELDKEETQSDWLARPLSEAQCAYATRDVTYLIHCWRLLEQRSREQQRYEWVLEDGARMTTGGRGPLAKFKNAWKLSPKELSVLLALIDWREQEARKRDKPRSWILADKTLYQLAVKTPKNMPKLAAIEGLSEGLLRRQGRAMLALIADAEAAAESSPPTPLPGPPNAAVKAQAKLFAAELETIAQRLVMAPEILMPNRELELLARQCLGEPTETLPHWDGWREKIIIAPLREGVSNNSKRTTGTAS